MITIIMADFTAKKFQAYYDNMEGISIPQPFCQSFVPFAVGMNWLLDKIPGFDKLNIDAEGMKKKFGLLGEPLFLGVIIGILIGYLSSPGFQNICVNCACDPRRDLAQLTNDLPKILGLGIKMGAVMELIPRITGLFIEGLKPISDATREFVSRKYPGMKGLSIGMSPALVIGHPTTLVVSILLIPVSLFLAVVLPGNKFLPLASLAGMFYLFPCVLPITKGNVLKTFLIGLVALVAGLYFATNLAPAFTYAAKDVYAATKDVAVQIPEGFSFGAALDFASALLCWTIYHLVASFKWIGSGFLVLFTAVLMYLNYRRIKKESN
jgi:PTS system galactitol-specific IIC component